MGSRDGSTNLEDLVLLVVRGSKSVDLSEVSLVGVLLGVEFSSSLFLFERRRRVSVSKARDRDRDQD